MLAGNVVTTAIREASLARADRAERAIDSRVQQRELAIAEALSRSAAWPGSTVQNQRALVAQTRAALPAAAARSWRAAAPAWPCYVGEPPGSADVPEFRLADLQLPAELPLRPAVGARPRSGPTSVPRGAPARASAQVGVATANLYPQLTCRRFSASSAATSGDLLRQRLQPLELGVNLAAAAVPRRRAAGAQARGRGGLRAGARRLPGDGAAGLQNVADVLRALEADAAAVAAARTEQAARAEDAYRITLERYRAGGRERGGPARRPSGSGCRRRWTGSAREGVPATPTSAALFQALGGGMSLHQRRRQACGSRHADLRGLEQPRNGPGPAVALADALDAALNVPTRHC